MPKPEKHLFICVQNRPPQHPSGSCVQRGGAEVLQAFAEAINTPEHFGRFAITTTGCMGPCNMGPNILVYPDGVMYCGVQKDDVKEIVEQHILGGKPVERLLAPKEIW
jgi:(2Fe-2S) ferredoxin